MKIDFKLDALSNTPLSMQLANALKGAIAKGIWKVGDVLPGIHELADRCCTSEKVPRVALERLAAEGWTRSKRGVGAVVLDRGADMLAKGRVLMYIRIRGWSHYFAELIFSLNARLLAAGCRMAFVPGEPSCERNDLRMFAEILKERWSLVLVCGNSSEARQLAMDSGWPFALMGLGLNMPKTVLAHPACVGGIDIRCSKAMPDFVQACIQRKVKHVVQLGYGTGALDVTSMLTVAGVKVESINVPPQSSPNAIYRASMMTMKRILRYHRSALPDIFLFVDDFVAQGALFALQASGVRIPEDVKIVMLANRGCGLTWPVPLTRLEMDPVEHGRAMANAITSYLETGRIPSGISLGSVWKQGETF